MRPINFVKRRRLNICYEGWLYMVVLAFLFVGAVLREINLLMVLFGMMVGPYLFSLGLVLLSLRDLQIRRRMPETITAGQMLVVDVEVTNAKKKSSSWAIATTDVIEQEAGPNKGEKIHASLFFPHIPPNQSSKQVYEGKLLSRGRYRLGPMRVTSRFPLGLLQSWFEWPKDDHVVVHPRQGHLSRRWTMLRQAAYQGRGKNSRQQGLVEGDFHGLRDWRSGDAQRWIHWRTSARLGELMVRQFEQHRDDDLAVLVDLWQPTKASEADRARVEEVVSFAATVVSDQCRRGGGQMLLSTAGREITMARGPASMALLQDASEALAVAEATDGDRVPELLAGTLDRMRPRTSVLLISTRKVDLSDTERFVKLWQDPRQRRWAGRIVCLDASSKEFESYFVQDDVDAPQSEGAVA